MMPIDKFLQQALRRIVTNRRLSLLPKLCVFVLLPSCSGPPTADSSPPTGSLNLDADTESKSAQPTDMDDIGSTASLADSGFQCRIDVLSKKAPRDPTVLRITLTNAGNSDISVLRYGTPLEPPAGPTLNVVRGGNTLKYVGPLARRPPATESDYVSVRSGTGVVATYNISDNYRLDAAGAHDVSVFEPWFRVKIDGAAPIKASHNCGSATFIVDDAETIVAASGSVGHAASELTTTSCSASQISQIARASSASKLAVTSAIVGQHVSSTDSFYATWFGAYTGGRGTTVTNNYSSVWSPIAADTIKYNCSFSGCGATWYAYTFGSCASNTVCLCNSFWSGDWIDSQMGTVIHEVSHLKASTNDTAYGQTACKNLAVSSPTQAIANADNYTYYGEYMYLGPVAAWMQTTVAMSSM